ncbi:putative copper transporter crmD [Aspergillus undulatus]|uniref:putative copper transporter crmD n=1 Tax=Aspergillus undulatus TaxID=1810928 RepID=UPI003CCD6941
MPMTFTSSTTVTLFFETWTTATPWAYTLTLFVLFTLAFINRFLAALRFQIEHSHSTSRHHSSDHVPILAPPCARRGVPKARLSPLPRYIQVDEAETEEGELQPSGTSELSGLVSEQKERPRAYNRAWRRLMRLFPEWLWPWTPEAPFSLRRDGARACLEGVRAFVGYIL